VQHGAVTSLGDLTWPVRTERLEISPQTPDDLPAVWAFRSLPAVQEWVGGAEAGLEEFAERFATRDSALVVRHGGVVVGDLMVQVGDGWGQREVAERAVGVQATLGWTIDPAHGGRGLATEAVRAALAVCFDGLGVRRVLAECFADNTASWRLMERVGMRREAHGVRASLHRSRGWVDDLTYALLAEEWRAARTA
jgi:RimJ/RimL family protein N-acetyltransferase